MKKSLLFISLSLFAFGLDAQVGADAVSTEAAGQSSIPMQSSPVFVHTRAVGVTTSVLPCGGGIDTLVASGACSYQWSTDSLGATVISSNDTLITGNLTNDTTLYLTGLEAELENLATLPPHASTFTGNVRGYYFVAPMDMVITGLYIPQSASSATQNVAILQFDNQTPPPVYSTTTNAFTNLGTWINFPANDTIFTCLPIDSGEVIGIYGQRATNNSYGNITGGITIGAVNVPIYRTGMQFNLTTTPMQDVWSEPTSTNFSRVEFFYDITPITETIPVVVNVPLPNSATTSVSICMGDSILLGGSYQTATGMYYDVLVNMDGCDSMLTTDLTVNPLPVVTMQSDTACLQAGLVTLNGLPAGGTFSGSGVSGGTFNTATGIGTYPITYAYTDGMGCTNSAIGAMVVEDCSSIGELSLAGIRIFPNPLKDEMHIDLPAVYENADVKLYDASGKLLFIERIQSGAAVLSTSSLAEGIYMVEVQVNGKSNTYKMVKK